MSERYIEVFVPDEALVGVTDRWAHIESYVPDRRVHNLVGADRGIRAVFGPPPTPGHYVDPLILKGLAWWDRDATVLDIPYGYRREHGALVALSDAWTLLSWSEWFSRRSSVPERLAVVHVDDHDDLMVPRLAVEAGSFVDLLTGREVDLCRPDTVADAVLSGAIGMGSFIAPLVRIAPRVDIFHLCDTGYARLRSQPMALLPRDVPDGLIAAGRRRPGVELGEQGSVAGSTYRAGSDISALLSRVPDVPVLVHIDLDFFNNRYNWDSDWPDRADRHDPPFKHMMARAELLITEIARLGPRVVDVAIGISPGFFPAEYWQPVCDLLVRGLASSPDWPEDRAS